MYACTEWNTAYNRLIKEILPFATTWMDLERVN